MNTEIPCKDCLIVSACRGKFDPQHPGISYFQSIIKCQLINEYREIHNRDVEVMRKYIKIMT